MAKKHGRGARYRQSKTFPRHVNNNQQQQDKNVDIGSMDDQEPKIHFRDDSSQNSEMQTLLITLLKTPPVTENDSNSNDIAEQNSIEVSNSDILTETTEMSDEENIDQSANDLNDVFAEKMDIDSDEMKTFPNNFIPRGITNHGNTCFINASLQALFAIPAFRQYFLNCYFRRLRHQSDFNLIDHLDKFFHQKLQPQTCDNQTVSKSVSLSLVNQIWFELKLRKFQQQDAQEFLKYLFNYIHEELKYINTRIAEDNSLHQNRFLYNESKRLVEMKQKQDKKYNQELYKFYTLCIRSQHSNSDYSNVHFVKPPLEYRSIVTDLFSGKLKNTVRCLSCQNSSSRLETFQDLSIPISILVKSNSSNNSLSQNTKISQRKTWLKSFIEFARTGNLLNVFELFLAYIAFMLVLLKYSLSLITADNYRLEDCLSRFFSQEVLSGDNSYQCDKCQKFTDCVKQLKIQALPDILTIHLNRYQSSSGNIQKLTSCIEFPLNGLDTSHFLSDDCSTESTFYDLVAVIAHSGAYMNCGHYVCYALNESDQEWYLYDDSRVMRISTENLIHEISSLAYILFYRKSIYLNDSSDPEDNISFAHAAREVCFDLEEIHILDSNVQKNYELIRNFYPSNFDHFHDHLSPAVFINRDAIYLPKYWINLFVNTENPGLFNNYEAFCSHGLIRQTEWLFFNRIVSPLIKPVGLLLYSIYGDVHSSFVLPPSPQLAVCHVCFNFLFQNQIICQKIGNTLQNLENANETIQFCTYFNGTVEVIFDSGAKNSSKNYPSDGTNGQMSGDLMTFNGLINDNSSNKSEKLYVIPYEWFFTLQNFTCFQNFGQDNCFTDYRQMITRFEQAISSEHTKNNYERLIPYPFKHGTNIIKCPFFPLSGLLKIAEKKLRSTQSCNDKSRNDTILREMYKRFLQQTDFNYHCVKKPELIDNWSIFGIKERIFDFFEKNQQELPDNNSEDLLVQLGKLIRSALVEDVYGYHFDLESFSKQSFEKELKYYVMIVSENVWNFFEETFGYSLEVIRSDDIGETQSFSINIDDKSLNEFYEFHYKPWLLELEHKK